MHCPQCGVENEDTISFCASCGSRLKEAPEAPPQSATRAFAGFWRRFVASLIDSFVVSIGVTVIASVAFPSLGSVSASEDELARAAVIILLVSFVLDWLYFTLLESSSNQATIGKITMGIIVTDLASGRISFARANGRYWGKIVSGIILMIGYIMAGFTEKKQALHDMMAHTLVLRKQSP